MPSFSQAKADFDEEHRWTVTADCIVPVDGKVRGPISIKNGQGAKIEEYYKWQFISSLVNSGLFSKDYIGVEVRFPKGSKSSIPLKMDGAIFDSAEWLERYTRYWTSKSIVDLDWLNEHLIAIMEFKKNDKMIEGVYSGQVRPAMREKEPSDAFVLGIYYDMERLWLFQRKLGKYLRLDEAKNAKGDASTSVDLNLHLPDPYVYVPSFSQLISKINVPSKFDRSKRTLDDLAVISGVSSLQLTEAFSHVLRTLDKANLVDQRGYSIIIQTLALKIFDEKRNEAHSHRLLGFYVNSEESTYSNILEKPVQNFIKRIITLRNDASTHYQKILGEWLIDTKNPSHVRAVVAICEAFQDYSFVRSASTDLYQLVFYNFANSFKRDEAAQFLTPLPVIDFIVQIVNPRNGETVCDPCCGIGDFLSMAYVNSKRQDAAYWLDDANIYGVDLDDKMITLATLNMLLSGDGEAKLFESRDKGSILSKIALNPARMVDLLPEYHAAGAWDNWLDKTALLKFDVVLTNPPFGEDRAFQIKSDSDKKIASLYETWMLTRPEPATNNATSKGRRGSESIDLGILFLENAVHLLKEEGRLGIVISNSIASIKKWEKVRAWFLTKMRLVAVFDLPPNVFAETGVNTSIIIAYKPSDKELQKINKEGYDVFARDITKIGYERRTSKRNVFFKPIYRLNPTDFNVEVDKHGMPVLEEEFSKTIQDFRDWTLSQEAKVSELFGTGNNL